MTVQSLVLHYNKIAAAVASGLYPPVFFNSGYDGLNIQVDSYNKGFENFCSLYVHLFEHYSVDANNKDILEVGCGFGRGCFFLKKRYNPTSVTGCDINPNILDVARQFFKKTEFINGDINNLQSINRLFDIVITIETEYYWNDSIDESFASVVKPGGDLLIATDVKRNSSIQKRLKGFLLIDEKDITENILLSLNKTPQIQKIYKKRIDKIQTTHHYISQHYRREQK